MSDICPICMEIAEGRKKYCSTECSLKARKEQQKKYRNKPYVKAHNKKYQKEYWKGYKEFDNRSIKKNLEFENRKLYKIIEEQEKALTQARQEATAKEYERCFKKRGALVEMAKTEARQECIEALKKLKVSYDDESDPFNTRPLINKSEAIKALTESEEKKK